MARIFLVDDHDVVRDGIAAIVDRSESDEVVGSQASLSGLDEALLSAKADILLLDISLRKGTSLDAIKALKDRHPSLRIIILSMHA